MEPLQRRAGSQDRLRRMIILAGAGAVLSLPDCAQAQSDNTQPPTRSFSAGRPLLNVIQRTCQPDGQFFGPSPPRKTTTTVGLAGEWSRSIPTCGLRGPIRLSASSFLNRDLVKEVDKNRLFLSRLKGRGTSIGCVPRCRLNRRLDQLLHQGNPDQASRTTGVTR